MLFDDDIVGESVRLLHDVLEVIYIAAMAAVGVTPVAVMEVAGRRALGMRCEKKGGEKKK